MMEEKRKTALVAADFMFNVSVQYGLTRLGWDSIVEEKANRALQAAKERRPDLAIIQLSGHPACIELIQELRADESLKDLSVLAFGSHKA